MGQPKSLRPPRRPRPQRLRSVQASADMNAAGRGADMACLSADMAARLGPGLVKLLAWAGYDTVEKLRAASDDGLLLVSGIDEFALRRIREVVG